MQPKVSIITVNFNGMRFLKDFFESVRNLDYENIELIFVDNASIDGSVDYVRRNWTDVKLICNKRNLGFSEANNAAAEHASGEHLFFLNNDTKVHPDAVSNLIKEMSLDPGLGICGCKMMSYDGARFFHSGIGVDIFGYPVARGPIFYAEGSALMIRKNLFEKIGGFDPDYFMFHEDIDLAWRVWLSGHRVSVAPEAIVYHSVGASAGGAALLQDSQYKSTYFRRYYSERNNIRTLFKNYSSAVLFPILIIYMIMNFVEMVFFLLLFKPKVTACYLKAYSWNISHLKGTFVCRKRIQSARKINDYEIIKKMYKGSGKVISLKKVNLPVFR